MDSFGFDCDKLMKPLDPEEFRRQGYMMIDFLANYYTTVDKLPVLSQVEPNYLRKQLPESAPKDPQDIETILYDIKTHIVPGITHWQSPNFFAYFSCTISTAAVLGEMLSSGINTVGFSWISSPAATELENIVMDWLGKMLNLPKSFLFSGNGGGVIQHSLSESNICTLVAARDEMLKKIGRNNINKLVVYGSDQTHDALWKSARVVGIPSENFRVIKTSRSTWYALSPELLNSTISSDIEAGLIPLFLCVTIGTTSTTAVDPLDQLCDVANKYDLWVHVDSAYAGSACICPEFRHFINGIEKVNSFSLNASKWLFAGGDCCCLWLKDPSAVTKSLSITPEFLRDKASESTEVVNYKDWQLSLGKKFRALKLWLVIKSFGVDNLCGFIRKHVEIAKVFEQLVLSDKRFEVVVPRNFSLVCFRVCPQTVIAIDLVRDCDTPKEMMKIVNNFNEDLLKSINASGKLHMIHTVIDEIFVIRFAIGATLTERHHVIIAWKVIQDHLDVIINEWSSK